MRRAVLTIWQLYAVGFVTGSLTVLFDVADQSYLPAILERADLVEGNAKLSLPQSSAQIVGPGFGGGLIGLLGAPFAVVVDAASFFASGALIALIRKPEPKPERLARQRRDTHEACARKSAKASGTCSAINYLRMIAGSTATSNLGTSIAFSIFPVFAYRELGLERGAGRVRLFGLGGLGVLLGAVISAPLSKKLGVGPAIVISMALSTDRRRCSSS
jgi:MFS family permease